MMATMRDDPESYKDLLHNLKQKKSAAPPAVAAEAQTPEVEIAASSVPAPQPTPDVRNSAQQITDSLPPAKSGNRSLFLIIGIVSLLILVFVFLMVFRII
jgi:hypothetical protein